MKGERMKLYSFQRECIFDAICRLCLFPVGFFRTNFTTVKNIKFHEILVFPPRRMDNNLTNGTTRRNINNKLDREKILARNVLDQKLNLPNLLCIKTRTISFATRADCCSNKKNHESNMLYVV